MRYLLCKTTFVNPKEDLTCIYGKEDLYDLKNVKELEKIAEAFVRDKKELAVIVVGPAVCLSSLIKAACKYKIPLTLHHYDGKMELFYAQHLFKNETPKEEK